MATRSIAFAPGVKFPVDAVTQTFAVIAKRGQGKTYTAMYLAECMLAAGNQIVAIDPVGVWYGLRLAANGKSKGFDIPVFGGVRGDLPLTPESGRLVAQVIVERNLSAVVDVSAMRKGERVRFLGEFGEELVHLKKTSRSPLHCFLEEAQTILAQRPMPGQERMKGAWSDVIQIGRNFGLGATLISQRPQLIDKDVLNQSECLIVGQLAGPQERKAIEAWIVDQGADLKALIAGLPGLGKHEKWVWSPQWLGVTVKVTVPAKATYDASKTPAAGDEKATPKPLGKGDLEQLRAAIAESIAQAEADDPKVLKQRIRALEAELARKPASVPAPEPEVRVVEKPVIGSEALGGIRDAMGAISQSVEQLQGVGRSFDEMVAFYTSQSGPPLSGVFAKPTVVAPLLPGANTSRPKKTLTTQVASPGRGELSGPECRVLDALAWFESIGVDEVHSTALAFIAGYRPGGGYNNTKGALRTKGLISYPAGGRVAFTPEGRPLAERPTKVADLTTLHIRVLSRLSNPEQRVLQSVLEVWPGEIASDDLAAASGYSPGGGYNNIRGKLRTLGLIDYPRPGYVRAESLLFPEGLR